MAERYNTDDPDGPQPIDLDFDPQEDDNDSETVRCPSCGQSVYRDAPRCPSCGEWLDAPGEAGGRAAGWFWPVIVALLIGVIVVYWHGAGR